MAKSGSLVRFMRRHVRPTRCPLHTLPTAAARRWHAIAWAAAFSGFNRFRRSHMALVLKKRRHKLSCEIDFDP